MSDYEWMMLAECRGKIHEMWDDSTPSQEALRSCFRCPVRKPCADYGLSRPSASDAGVLGGLGLYDRDKIREGKKTVQQVLKFRLNQLIGADWDDALAEDFRRLMPQLELV